MVVCWLRGWLTFVGCSSLFAVGCCVLCIVVNLVLVYYCGLLFVVCLLMVVMLVFGLCYIDFLCCRWLLFVVC